MIIPVRNTLLALLFGTPLVGCNDSGPTAIEIRIATLDITNGCPVMIEGSTCNIDVIARTEEGQVVANPVLRWSSNDSSVAILSNRGLIEAVSPGAATVTVRNSTDTASDNTQVTVIPNTGDK
jgi:hypothetical protein